MINIDSSFFKITTENLAVQAGDLIVAEPFLRETWFDRAVISIIDHSDEEGTTGVVLNHPIVSTLDEVLDGVTEDNPVKVYCGGPLGQDRLYFIHSLGSDIIPDARQYAAGLWIGGDFEAAISYVNEGYPIEGNIRFFVGYSGWSEMQLDDEIKDNTWAVLPEIDSATDILQGEGDAYWHKAVRALGTRYRLWQLLPHDAKFN